MKWGDSEYREITKKIIKAFYKVHDTLGPGFLEEAYHTITIKSQRDINRVSG